MLLLLLCPVETTPADRSDRCNAAATAAARSTPVCLKMATENDLINAVRDSLESDGVLGRLKAEIRTEVMRLLDGPSTNSNRITKIESPRNVILMNELVREYLDWIGYKYTSSILIAECKLSKQPLDRSFLAQDLGVRENETTKNIPLLYSLVEMTKSANNSKDNFP